ncbi:MAG: UDP-2,3-diacylglucosamine diphosphatase [Pseudomonadota bacterium]|nr:UDP-2,3-diacylglucosamine diphosphatase [Pseudomonadota bacterium]
MIFGKAIELQRPGAGGQRCLFLADAHLRDPHEANYEALMGFLSRLAGPDTPASGDGRPRIAVLDHLFILGDFFDFWFSRRERIYPGFKEIVAALKDLQSGGVAVHFCEGNHDFFLSRYFSRLQGMHVHEDWAVLALDGKRLLVGHGDLVDETNRRYLRLRRMLRSRAFFALQGLLPLPLLWRIARLSSQASQEYLGGAKEAIFAKMAAFARDRFREGFDAVILGHCHHAELQEGVTSGRKTVFATVGDWVAGRDYLLYHDGGFHPRRYEG